MRRILYHPLWTHGVAAAIVVWVVVEFLLLGPLPERVPVHFGWGGQANRYGGPWEVWIFTVAMPLAFLAGSVALDELWARQEGQKHFNFFAPLDEALLGWLAGMSWAYFATLSRDDGMLRMDWTLTLSLMAGAVGLACLLEWLRPHRPVPAHLRSRIAAEVQTDIRKRIAAGKHWVYWQTQNPLYLSVVAVVAIVPLLFALFAVTMDESVSTGLRWIVAGAIVLGIVLMGACYGGLRVMVTCQRLRASLGVFGIPLLSLATENLAEARVEAFSPLRDYGGWGIRLGRRGWGFFFRGTEGVLVTTKKGRHFLIGSDNPEALAAAITAAIEAAGANCSGNMAP
jgi:hypothetical protein